MIDIVALYNRINIKKKMALDMGAKFEFIQRSLKPSELNLIKSKIVGRTFVKI